VTAISASNTKVGTPLLLFGGSFDPVHAAHLQAALAASQALGGAPVTFLPNARSPHKDAPGASNAQRLAMLELALAPFHQFSLSRHEIERPAPSYTHASLVHFRERQGQAPLVLVIGADSLANLHRWRQWQDFPALCHLLVLPRPGSASPTSDVIQGFPAADAATLLSQPAGYRLQLEQPLIELSSTHIRAQLASGIAPDTLPAAVAAYIQTHHLYRR
jgi:nicotinate-nucleotide adenylyltransferase